MTFRVGQKVVCVDVSGWNDADYLSWSYPRLGEIGTVIGFSFDGEHPCVLLAEHPNPTAPTALGGFRSRRFRPIVEKKTEISFTANAPKDSEKWDNRKRVKVRA